jgi:RNA polymerase sigma-70 factor, ECF subfamily
MQTAAGRRPDSAAGEGLAGRPAGAAAALGATGDARPAPPAAGSFDDFYAAAAMRVLRHAFALTGNLADAQDVAQEAFARAWQRWGSVRGCDSPEAWVRRVATNLAISRFRRERSARTAVHDLIAENVPEISPDTVALVAALRVLPERQRVVVVLHYLADLPVAQIAAELGSPAGSVKVWLARGREALAASLREDAGRTGPGAGGGPRAGRSDDDG